MRHQWWGRPWRGLVQETERCELRRLCL